MKTKSAQVTIFVIIAIAIIAIIGIFFAFRSGVMPGLDFGKIKNPESFIDSCIEQDLKESIEKISLQGGFSNPSNLLIYNGTEVSYLCHTSDYERLCVNKHPMLKQEIERQIHQDIESNLEDCFQELEESYERDDYSEEPTKFEIKIKDKRVQLSIDKRIEIVREEGNKKIIEGFDINTPSPVLDFVKITNEIINQEVSCSCGLEACNADRVQIMKDNKDFRIDKFMTSRDEEIYHLEHIPTKKEFNFAIRNCIKP